MKIYTDTNKTIYFIHNQFQKFYETSLKWFSDNVYPLSKTQMMQTYNQQIQEIKQKNENGNDIPVNNLPLLILDPTQNISSDPSTNFLWKFSDMNVNNLQERQGVPLFKDHNFGIYTVNAPMTGTLSFTLIFETIYQYLDQYMILNQKLRGLGNNRYLNAFYFYYDLIFDTSILDLSYEDDYHNEVQLTVEKLQDQYIQENKFTGGKSLYYPMMTLPLLQFTGVSDGSTHRNQNDRDVFSLDVSINYQVDLPSYLIFNWNTRVLHFPDILSQVSHTQSISQSTDSQNKSIWKYPDEFNNEGDIYENTKVVYEYELTATDIENGTISIELETDYEEGLFIILNNNIYMDMKKEKTFTIDISNLKENDLIKICAYQRKSI